MPQPLPPYYPAATSLRTGDLLFPKRIPSTAAALESAVRWTTLSVRARLSEALHEPDRSPKMAEVLDPTLVAAARQGMRFDVSGLLAPPAVRRLPARFGREAFRLSTRLTELSAAPGAPTAEQRTHRLELEGLGHKMLQQAETASDSTEDARRLSLMYFILTRAFGDLLIDWLAMTVHEFLDHPLSELLLGAIERERGEGFFIGHVAMVLCETDGAHDPDGKVWVIEANATDFSHYSVAVHPYLVDGEPLAPTPLQDGRLRGWANRRLALGESLWHCRHTGLLGQDAEVLRGALVHEAKKYLGRRYGFFDDPEFGDAGRFYCSEFVHRVFADLGGSAMALDEHRSWAWLVDHASLLGSAQFAADAVDAINAEGLYARMQKERFFLITLPMLYACSRLQKLPVAGAPVYQPA